MPTLQVRDLPEDLYLKLTEAANREHRSLAQQAIALLAQALRTTPSPRERRNALLDQIAASGFRKKLPRDQSPQKLIREDRNR
ncbi:MAG: hypothetical protein JNL98_03125 [Bryobacterales bacterium]|nr:hypothetical protein [Bryobacterales bacterium]